MKQTTKLLSLSLCTVILFSGCFLKSVHPLVTEKDAIFLENLEGVFEGEDSRWTFVNDPETLPELQLSGDNYDGTFTVEPDSGSTVFENQSMYLVLYEDIKPNSIDTTVFIGLIGEFNGNKFLDLSLLDLRLEGNTFRNSHLFAVHTFSRISLTDDLLTLYFFKDSWIRELIMGNRVRIKHERIPDGLTEDSDDILITASTKELQKFILKYGDESEPFDDPIGLKRINRGL